MYSNLCLHNITCMLITPFSLLRCRKPCTHPYSLASLVINLHQHWLIVTSNYLLQLPSVSLGSTFLLN